LHVVVKKEKGRGSMGAGTLPALKMKEREARRELILAAARKLFAEKDFRSVTVREIARAVEVSPGTIYRYYENLDDLFLDVFFAGARDLTELVHREHNNAQEFSLQRFCEIYVAYLNENMSFYQMMGHFMLGGKLSHEATMRLNPIMRELMSSIEEIIRKARPYGETRFLAHALFSALNGIMISYARYPGRDLEEIRRHTLRLAGVVAGCFDGSG
jgi:AcrR family transcriptional regulator